MADVSKLNGYTIRDDTARNQITTLSNRVDALSEQGAPFIENAHIVFAGDSNWAFGSDPLNKFLEIMPTCTAENIHTGGGSWDNIYTQVTGYQGTPDVFLLNAGGNSINTGGITAQNVGYILGEPDVRDHTVYDMSVSGHRTVFNYMKATFQYIRDTWPRCLIYVVVRSNQPFKPRSVWYYFKFYEQQICQEWGVPVIDANNIMNLTYWNDTQKAIYNQADEQHFTNEAYMRYLPGIASMLNACSAVQFTEMPHTFFPPQSVLNTALSNTDIRNSIAMVKWIAAHCAPMYTGAWGVTGRGQAYMSAGVAATCRFTLEVNYNNDLEPDYRAIIMENDGAYYLTGSTYTGDTYDRLANVETRRFINASTDVSIRTARTGVYTLLNAVANQYQADGDLPDTVGGTLIVTNLREDTSTASGNRTFLYQTATKNKLYIGYNFGGGTITWATVL